MNGAGPANDARDAIASPTSESTEASTGIDARLPLPELLDKVTRAAHAAGSVNRDQATAILAASTGPMPPEIGWTAYDGGKTSTRNGDSRSWPWAAFGDELRDYAQRTAKKGTGKWFMGATTTNGRCRDQDIEAITILTLDRDEGIGHAEWNHLRAALAPVASVFQRSSSHTAAKPKWHAHVPLSAPCLYEKRQWRVIWRWLVGYFAALGGLEMEPDRTITDPRSGRERPDPRYGFDHKTDRLGQPIFPAAKRFATDEPPETIVTEGKAFDLEKFLASSGFDPAWLCAPTDRQEPSAGPASAWEPLDAATIDPSNGLLALAFAESGMLGPRIDRGGYSVECPDEFRHTTGTRFDTSTVIFDPGPGQTKGHFHCSHRCGDLTLKEVLALLPADAVERARARWSEAIEAKNNETKDASLAANFGDADAAHFTELGNSLRLVRAYGEKLRHCRDLGGWFVWDGARWKLDKTGAVVRMAKRIVAALWHEAKRCKDADVAKALRVHAAKSEKANAISAMVKLAESADGVGVEADAFDVDPWIVNVQNGILDLQTGKLRPHDPVAMCSKIAKVAYDRDAKCPTWDAFLTKVLPLEEVRSFSQRYAGYSMTGVIRERVIVLLIGRGKNGKSVFVRTLVGMLGDYAKYAAPHVLITDPNGNSRHPAEIADLCGARYVAMSETKKGSRFDEETLKRLTGNEPVKGRFMRENFFQFEMTAKLTMAANHRPHVDDTTESIWDRIHEIPFTVRITKQEEKTDLYEQLREELPGILNWALVGCAAWRTGGLLPPKAVVEATHDYRAQEDRLFGFFDQCLCFHVDATEKRDVVRDCYERWAKLNEKYLASSQDFTSALRERILTRHGWARGEETKKVKGDRHWSGVHVHVFDEETPDVHCLDHPCPQKNEAENI